MLNTMQAMNLGMPSSKKKKPTHRGRKPSTKPGAQHLSALTQAHGAGDLKAAKTAALNYAKAVHSHMGAMSAPDMTNMTEPDGVDMSQPVAPAPAQSMAMRAMMARSKGMPK